MTSQILVRKNKKDRTGTSRAIPQAYRLSERGSVALDVLRGAAALLVFIAHARNLFLVDSGGLGEPQPSLSVRCLYFVSGFGHLAVIVFFVLSGYFIGSSVLRDYAQLRWKWSHYLLHRCVRLYAVLIPALLLGALWDLSGLRMFGSSVGIFSSPVPTAYQSMFFHPIRDSINVGNWLGSLFFLQGVRCDSFGSNGPLWSLSYEFWYYLLFPLLVGAGSIGSQPWWLRVGKISLALSLFWFVGWQITLYFAVWLVGAVIAGLVRSFPLFTQSRVYGFIMMVAFAATLVLHRADKLSLMTAWGSDLLLGAVFGAYLVYLVQLPGTANSVLFKKVSQGLARISYSLYLLHVPLLVFLNGLLLRGRIEKWQPDAEHLIALSAICLLALVYTILIWSITESKTEILRKFLVHAFTNNRTFIHRHVIVRSKN